MSIVADLKQTKLRFSTYIDSMVSLLSTHGIRGWSAPILLHRKWRDDDQFRGQWNSIWLEIAKGEGGKVTLGTAALIIGLVLGGVGVASGGAAIGLPAAAILVPLGYLTGNEVDQNGWARRAFSRIKQTLNLPAAGPGGAETGQDETLLQITELQLRCETLEIGLHAALQEASDRKGVLDAFRVECTTLKTQVGSISSQVVEIKQRSDASESRTEVLLNRILEQSSRLDSCHAEFESLENRLSTMTARVSWAILAAVSALMLATAALIFAFR